MKLIGLRLFIGGLTLALILHVTRQAVSDAVPYSLYSFATRDLFAVAALLIALAGLYLYLSPPRAE